jgi:hypothetical protein
MEWSARERRGGSRAEGRNQGWKNEKMPGLVNFEQRAGK